MAATTYLINRDRPWHIQGCSAKTGEGLQDGMEWIVSQINDSSKSKAETKVAA
jgi:hypothetical protein